VVCILISTIGGIYRAMEELHFLGEVDLAPSGGRSAKPRGQSIRWSGLHRLSLLPWPPTPHVYMCPRSRGPNRHKTWPASRPLGPLSQGFGPLGLYVKYTLVVMMILIFSQLYYVIP
jgi:hypothetical protein